MLHAVPGCLRVRDQGTKSPVVSWHFWGWVFSSHPTSPPCSAPTFRTRKSQKPKRLNYSEVQESYVAKSGKVAVDRNFVSDTSVSVHRLSEGGRVSLKTCHSAPILRSCLRYFLVPPKATEVLGGFLKNSSKSHKKISVFQWNHSLQ